MELRLYDTLTREKRVFTPIDPKRVRMYVCGPTVYDYAHIGNARPVIVFDVLFRLLRHLYPGEGRVTYVRNVTDVDDKINARAAERGISIGELTKTTYENFKADVDALGCLPPTVEPRATDYVSKPAAPIDMIRLIERLIANGNAYVAEGHVLFAVSTMPDYGRLSKRSLDEMEVGARVEVAPYKRNPMDFVLWKPSPPELPGWDSPWGRGRPGWHIECSAMSAALLGETFDIHGGGIDLVFPHHENEIAQSRCAFHTPVMANYWMHNGFLQVEGEKMSKSVGNFVTVVDLLKTKKFGNRDWSGWIVRLAMFMTYYRQPIDWTVARCVEAEAIWESWIDALSSLEHWDFEPIPSRELIEPLLNDLDTSGVVTVLHDEAKQARQDIRRAEQLARNLLFLGLIPRIKRMSDYIAAAGTYTTKIKKYSQNVGALDAFRLAKENFEIDKVNTMIEDRLLARARKDFVESDRIRDELAAMGVVLKDSKDGTTWEIAR